MCSNYYKNVMPYILHKRKRCYNGRRTLQYGIIIRYTHCIILHVVELTIFAVFLPFFSLNLSVYLLPILVLLVSRLQLYSDRLWDERGRGVLV